MTERKEQCVFNGRTRKLRILTYTVSRLFFIFETIIQAVSFNSIPQVNECFGQISECHLTSRFSDLITAMLNC